MIETTPVTSNHRYRYLWIIVRVLFISAIFLLIFSRINLSLFLIQVRGIQLGYALAGLVVVILAIGIVTLRWKILLDVVAPGVKLVSLLVFSFVGIFYSQFLPGNVTGDLVKGYYLARTNQNKVSIFSSVIVDRFTGISINGLIGLVALSTNTTILKAIRMNPNVPVILVILTLVGVVAAGFVFMIFSRWQHRFPAVIVSFYEAFRLYLKHPVALAKAGIVNLIFFFVWGIGFWALALSVGLSQLNFPTIILILAAVNFTQTIPISINGWGMREGALILLLAAYGVPGEQALLLSLLVAVTNLSAAVLGGVFVLADYRHIRQHSKITGD
jgi:uncharacterized protein (TIRG00374 family)